MMDGTRRRKTATTTTRKINIKKAERMLLFAVAIIGTCLIWTSTTMLMLVDDDTEEQQHQYQQQSSSSLRSSAVSSPAIAIASSQVQQKQQQRQTPKERPYFILHIGPPKTATTSIQCTLQQYSHELAVQDRYYYVGKTCPGLPLIHNNNTTNGSTHTYMPNQERTIPGHYLIQGLNDHNPHNRGYEALQARIDYHYQRGNHIIYSNEAFANHMIDQNSTWETLLSLFTKNGGAADEQAQASLPTNRRNWKVRIVIGYRHYYDFIRSFYYQHEKQNKHLNQKWPTEGHGKYHPAFLSYLDSHLQYVENQTIGKTQNGGVHNAAWGQHLTVSAYQKFQTHFRDIRILNLHPTSPNPNDTTTAKTTNNADTIGTQFVCDMLPTAHKTCALLRRQQQQQQSPPSSSSQSQRVRPLQSLDDQRIAEAAFDRGYITEASPKDVIVRKIQQRLQETGLDHCTQEWIVRNYFVCPSAQLQQRFLTVSLEYEQEILRMMTRTARNNNNNNDNKTYPYPNGTDYYDYDYNYNYDKRVALHKALYDERDTKEYRFCEINTTKIVVDDPEWIQFLSKIGTETKITKNRIK